MTQGIKISIITVVFNDEEGILDTIRSVLNQTYENIEYIIIDGNSSDGTLNILNRYKNDFAVFISEPDTGLYDAMNKGIEAATGNFCMFLNSGDVLYSRDTIQNYASHIHNLDMIYFAYAIMTDQESIYRMRPPEGVEIKDWLRAGNLPNHQSMLFPKSFYKTNFYNLDFRYSSDDEYKIRALSNHSIEFIPIWAVLFKLDGISRSFRSLHKVKSRLSEARIIIGILHKGRLKKNWVWIKFYVKSYLQYFIIKVFKVDHRITELIFNKFYKIPKGKEGMFRPQ